jgi:L-fuconolactonase
MIDSHQHFWKYDPVSHAWITTEMRIIKRDFLPEHLTPILEKHGMEGCVAVQAEQSDEETEFLLALADKNDFIKGVVGWINLRSRDLEQRLQYYSGVPKLKGFRHIVQSEAKGFLLQPAFIQGVKLLSKYNFTYDLLIYHHQLDEALTFASEVKDVRIVVDHIAKPSIRTGEKTQWELNLAALSTFENVYCKISGMVTEANWKNWTYEQISPYLDEVFECFGTNRVMYGSDWPVCLLAATYEQQFLVIQHYISKLSPGEKANVLGENAKRFYNL